jgi:hypothetical protein
MVDGFYQQWQFDRGIEIIKNIENINGVRLKMPTSLGLTPLMECHFITSKFSYKHETLASSQYKCKKTKNCKKKRTTKKHSRLKETAV